MLRTPLLRKNHDQYISCYCTFTALIIITYSGCYDKDDNDYLFITYSGCYDKDDDDDDDDRY